MYVQNGNPHLILVKVIVHLEVCIFKRLECFYKQHITRTTVTRARFVAFQKKYFNSKLQKISMCLLHKQQNGKFRTNKKCKLFC